MGITHRGIALTQAQLDAIIPVLNRRPMPRGRRFEALAEKAMADAGVPITGQTFRYQRKRTAGFRLPPNTVCVDRTSSLWGNPYRVQDADQATLDPRGQPHAAQADAVALHEQWLFHTDEGRRVAALARLLLHGSNLACFCAEGSPCHGDTLLRVASTAPMRDFVLQIKAEIRRLRAAGDRADVNAYYRDAAVLRRRAFDYGERLRPFIPVATKKR